MRCRRRSACVAPDRTSRVVIPVRSPCGTARWNALSRNALTPEQYSAGQKYRHHWYHAGLADRLESIDLNRIFAIDLGAYSGMAKTESQLFHRQRYREAAQAVGKIGSHVLEWAVCREIALEQVGQTLGWSSRPQAYAAAVERMKTALDELCKLWGIGH
jgi:Domain of unknown function (DUF6456)